MRRTIDHNLKIAKMLTVAFAIELRSGLADI